MEDLVADFRRTVDEAAKRMLLMSEEESRRPLELEKWSPKEIVGHLIDSASNNHQRFVRAQFQDDLVFPGYEQEAWVRLQRYQEEPWPRLVELWKAFNLHLAHLMEHTHLNELRKPRVRHNLQQLAWRPVSQDEPTTLEYFMRDYVGHLKHHLQQIFD